MRATEPGFVLAECFEDGERNACPISDACVLIDVLWKALAAFLGVLDRHALADLLASAEDASAGASLEMGR